MFEALRLLLELGKTNDPVNVRWEQVSPHLDVGYFSVGGDTYFIKLVYFFVELNGVSTPALMVSFGYFKNGLMSLALTKKDSGAIRVLGTVIRAVDERIAEVRKREKNLIIVFTAKRVDDEESPDSDEDFEHRVAVYSLIVDAQAKRTGLNIGRVPIPNGELFYLSKQELSKADVLRVLKSEKVLTLGAIKRLYLNNARVAK